MNKRQHTSLLITLSAAALILLALTPEALAQPAEEPYYEQVVEIHLPPPTLRVRPARQHFDTERPPCGSCAAVHRKVDSGPFVSLDANVGYGGYSWAFGEAVSGAVFSGSLSVLWGAGQTKGGFRLSGYYSTTEGEVKEGLDGGGTPVRSRLAGGSAMVQGAYKGLWGSTGLGVVHVDTDSGDGGYDNSYFSDSSYTLPELCMAAGYNLQLSNNFALRVSGEVGTFFFLSWRASVSGGVMVTF